MRGDEQQRQRIFNKGEAVRESSSSNPSMVLYSSVDLKTPAGPLTFPSYPQTAPHPLGEAEGKSFTLKGLPTHRTILLQLMQLLSGFSYTVFIYCFRRASTETEFRYKPNGDVGKGGRIDTLRDLPPLADIAKLAHPGHQALDTRNNKVFPIGHYPN